MPDAARVRFPPPLVFVLATGAGFGLHGWGRPWPLPVDFRLCLGIAGPLALAAIGLGLSSLGRFRATKQDPMPWTPTPELITGGAYRWTRNPMYLALGLLQAAAGVALANLWILALLPPALATVHLIAVLPEERYLAAKFGESYEKYRASVRRWI